MIILAIDTSCDDTSASVCRDTKVLSNVVSSQVRYHKKFGGVVPFLAKRLHAERIDSVIELALSRAKVSMEDVEALAVTFGPGLAPALEIGIQKARELSVQYKLPLYAVNHMAGHIASCYVDKDLGETSTLALLASGGHTELVLFEEFGTFEILGETLDDAVGESFDKVAKMLGLGYPGGRVISKLADEGDPTVYTLPVPMVRSGNLNFSYSGLKNAVRLLIFSVKDNTHHHVMEAKEMRDICAAFQEVALKALVIKVEGALREHPEVSTLLLAGGVARNTTLRAKLRTALKPFHVELVVPKNPKLCTDNAAMIGVACAMGIQKGQQPVDPAGLDRKPGLRLDGK